MCIYIAQYHNQIIYNAAQQTADACQANCAQWADCVNEEQQCGENMCAELYRVLDATNMLQFEYIIQI